MKILELNFPKIKVSIECLARLEAYAKNMKKRGLILCDCKIDEKTDEITIVEAHLVPQTWDYSKNAQKYEEINDYIGYSKDENGDFIYTQCMIRVELSKNSSITDEDFKYFESICEAEDFLIVGDITQGDKTKSSTLTLYYMDLEHRVAMCYGSPYEDSTNFDKKWEFSFGSVPDSEINAEIREMCQDKKYGYSSNYGYNYGNYNTQNKVNNATEKKEEKVEKSELNKTDPEISSLVSTGKKNDAQS